MSEPFTTRSLQRLSKVHPDLQKVMKEAVVDSPVPFQISQGLRTYAEQQELYAQGRTKPGAIVTWTMNSRHLTGNAVDVAVIIGGKYITATYLYDQLAAHILKVAARLGVKLVWGGTWPGRKKDRPHFERA